jgi:cyclomaltodextrinase / maltogenic alpha-amylase / neopullulanase
MSTNISPQAVMADFVFGGIEADEARLLATERAARAGIRHFQQIEPLDPLPGQRVTVTVQVGPEVVVDRVTLYYTVDGTNPQGEHGDCQNGAALQLEPMGVRWEPLIWDYIRLWQGQIPGQADGTLVQYRIEGWRSYAEPNSVWSREMNLDRTVERPALYGYWVDTHTVPAWAHEAILYHVFVDRFAGLPDGAANRWLGPEEIDDFVGGSIRGVIESLDYIAGTGATALWLSPVFVTTTYHGYDTTDYYHVDPRFGTDADLVELFEQAHRRELRVILDFVANHTSVDFAPFVEARDDAGSRYRRWFSFDKAYKHGYRAFFDVAKMPQFNTEEPEVRAYLNHAAQHWLALGADGLRLDYAAGPNHLFWSAFRAACRSVKPDCWLFGEVTRAGDVLRAYAGRLDGCLDFGFCRSIRMLAAGETPALALGQFINQVAAGRRYYGPAAQIDFVLPAFLDNHDMNRFLWVANDDKQRLRLALGILFALGGPPILYYGTEVGLGQPRAKGAHREEARHPMLWGEAQDHELLAYVQAWARARRRHPSLGRGEVRTLYYGEGGSTWVGELAYGEDKTILAINMGDEAAGVPLPPGRYLTITGDSTDSKGTYRMPPKAAACFWSVTDSGA